MKSCSYHIVRRYCKPLRSDTLIDVDESILSRMITTIDDGTNGFRTDVLPMALSSRNDSSRSLLKAILAVSAFHIGKMEEALTYKVSAIQSLALSVQTAADPNPAQLAACMMLCVYSVS